MDQSRQSNDEQALYAPQANVPAEPVMTVPRTSFNYVIIAAVFFVMGVVIGVFFMDSRMQQNNAENRALINQAVQQAAQAFAAAGGGNQAAAGPRLDPGQRYAIDAAGNPSIGPADASVTIIEFGDFRCGFCKRFHDETRAAILERYQGRVLLVFRDYPILGQSSFDAANAAECADDQGRFWEYQDLLYANQATLVRDAFIAHAQSLGMDVATFTACYDEQRHEAEILADYQAGEALGVGGTPTFFINGRPLIGAQPIDAFVNVIEDELSTGG